MTDDERRAAFAEAVERSRVMLDEEACRDAIATETVKPRTHREDGFAHDWAATMPPKPEPAPVQRRKLTDAEALRGRQWERYTSDQIAAALAEHRKLWLEVHGAVIAEERKRWRAKVAKLELRVDALTHEATKRQTIDEAAERATIIDLPIFVGKRDAARA